MKKNKVKPDKPRRSCAFCGEPTYYYSWELACYICIDCLAKYKNKIYYTPLTWEIR